MPNKYTVVDLFAGAGGLSSGFEKTKKFRIKAFVENNPRARETYQCNHIGVKPYDDIKIVDFKDVNKENGPIDVVVGGPPCQGFSNANRQHNCAINQNNLLVKEYVRAVLELKPQAFVLENVGMLKSDVHKFLVTKGEVLDDGLQISADRIILLDEKYVRPELQNVLMHWGKIKKCRWNDTEYAIFNTLFKRKGNPKRAQEYWLKHKKHFFSFDPEIENNTYSIFFDDLAQACVISVHDYFQNKIGLERFIEIIEPAVMYQRMLGKIAELRENRIHYKLEFGDDIKAEVQTYAVLDYLKIKFHQAGYGINSKVLCAANFGVPQKRHRFIMLGVKGMADEEISLPEGGLSEKDYRTVRDAIYDLEKLNPIYDVNNDTGIQVEYYENMGELYYQLHDSDIIFNHIVTATRDAAMQRFKVLKPGDNFHALDEALKKNTYTDIKRTQNTIYQRLDYDKPSGTVLNVRKSMWIHPVVDRAISIREAARLQSFSDSYVFKGTKDSQYQQVGNAVPPFMASAIARRVCKYLNKLNICKK